MPLDNCKIELKLKWTKYCLLSAAGTGDINNIDSNNIVFTIRNLKFYVPVGFLSARNNQKLSKLHSKRFESWFYWNEYKRKGENKTTTNVFRYFIESNFGGANRLFVLVCTNADTAFKS